jgi:hypothetical protein
MIDDECGSVCGMRIGRGNRSRSRGFQEISIEVYCNWKHIIERTERHEYFNDHFNS